jgi:hypothetical protein
VTEVPTTNAAVREPSALDAKVQRRQARGEALHVVTRPPGCVPVSGQSNEIA